MAEDKNEDRYRPEPAKVVDTSFSSPDSPVNQGGYVGVDGWYQDVNPDPIKAGDGSDEPDTVPERVDGATDDRATGTGDGTATATGDDKTAGGSASTGGEQKADEPSVPAPTEASKTVTPPAAKK